MTPKRSWQLLIALALVAAVGLSSHGFAASKELKQLEKDFTKAISGEDEASAVTALETIAGIGGADAIELLYDLGMKFATTPKLYETTLKSLGRMDGTLAFLQERYAKIDSKGDFRERVFIVDITAVIPGDDAVVQLGAFLKDDSSFVQGAAVEHLAKTMKNQAIGPLLELLEVLSKKRKDVLYHQVRDALWTLTGQDFDVIDDWKSWWEPNRATFDPKATDHEGKTGVKRKRRGEDDPDFWGVPVESKNVVFVIDTSGSMKYVMKVDIPGLARGDGSDSGQGTGGGGGTHEDHVLAEFWMRMSMAKRELKRVIGKLDKDALFNCVRFDSTTSKFQKQAVPATPGNKKNAQEWTDEIKHKGNTATLDALVEAFNADARTNTIYFLSDGLPSKDGKVNDPTRPILDKLFELNRFRKIKIHTFGFDPNVFPPNGGPPNPDLVSANQWLKELADATGGTFTVMKVDPKRTPQNPDGD